MLRGLSTVNLFAGDLAAAVAWYTELLGVQPYFQREIQGATAYVEFRIGDFEHELGLIDARFAPHPRPEPKGGPVTYWHVDDVRAAFDRLVSMGATVHEKVTERGPGFVTASVIDPFGNLLGVMYNQHYLEIVDSSAVR